MPSVGGEFMGGLTGMRGASAARRTEQERAQPPDAASVIAELGRVLAETSASHGRLDRRTGDIAAVISRLEKTGTDCGSAERVALLADKLGTRLAMVTVELISGAAHLAEAREQGERLAALFPPVAAMYEAGIAEGRRREAEERDAQPVPARAPGARHAARRRHLASVPGIPSAVTRAAAAGIVAAGLGGGLVAGMHEESFRHVAVPAARVAWHPMAPDQAAVIPQPWSSPSPRPSVAAASARPAPVVTPGAPVFSSPPASPQPVFSSPPPAPVPVLDVPRVLDLGASTRGVLSLAATGQDGVTWTARTTDGITLSAYAGTLVQGQPVTLQVTDPAGGAGWVYVSAGPETFAVHVTSALGAPVAGL